MQYLQATAFSSNTKHVY